MYFSWRDEFQFKHLLNWRATDTIFGSKKIYWIFFFFLRRLISISQILKIWWWNIVQFWWIFWEKNNYSNSFFEKFQIESNAEDGYQNVNGRFSEDFFNVWFMQNKRKMPEAIRILRSYRVYFWFLTTKWLATMRNELRFGN